MAHLVLLHIPPLMLYLSPLPPLNIYLPTRSLLSFSSLCHSICSSGLDYYTLPFCIISPQPLPDFTLFSLSYIPLPYLSLPQFLTTCNSIFLSFSRILLPISLIHSTRFCVCRVAWTRREGMEGPTTANETGTHCGTEMTRVGR